MVHTEVFTLDSEGSFFAANVTDRVAEFVTRSGIREGCVSVFYLHTTGTVLLLEHEASVLVDLEQFLENVLPLNAQYTHNTIRQVDSNGCSHIRSILLGTHVVLPVCDGKLLLGQWQEVVIIDLADGRKPRQYVLQVMGE